MNIRETINKRIMKPLQHLRNPAKNSLYDNYITRYPWITQRPQKQFGRLQTYYNALKNPYVNACLNVYEMESLNCEFTINNPSTDKVDYNHVNYLTNLFNHPMGINDSSTWALLNHNIWYSWKGTGDCFIEATNDDNNIINGLQYIPTELVWRNFENDCWALRNTEITYEPDELIHIYKPAPQARDSLWGVSVIDTIADELRLQLLGADYNAKGFESHGGLDPRGIIKFGEDISIDEFNNEIERIGTSALTNPEGILALKGGDYQKTGTSNKDMQFLELMNYTRNVIITAFQLQPHKLGIIESGNLGGGTGEAQDTNFKKVLKGNCRVIEDSFNKVLGHNGFEEIFQYGELDIEDKLQRAQIENIRLQNGSLTVNEVRSEYGEEPVEWGDTPNNTQSNVMPVMNSLDKQVMKSLKEEGLIR